MEDEQKREYGILHKLPTTLEESLAALEENHDLKNALGKVLVDDYIIMKREEKKMLDDMPEQERHVWLVERY